MSVAPRPVGATANRFSVHVRNAAAGWSVAIVDPDGRDAFVRACRDEAEARVFASTVGQHIGWLSEDRFREIYRLGGARGAQGANADARGVAPRKKGA